MRKKHLLIAMSLLLAIGMAAGCSKKQAGGTKGPEAAAPKYNLYAPAGAGFTVELPAGIKEMKKESTSFDTPLGKKNANMYMAQEKGVILVLGETDLKGEKLDYNVELENSLKGVAEHGTILKKDKIQIGGNPAINARIKLKENGKDSFVQFLVVFANEEQFQLQARSGDEKALDSPDIKNFVNSFKLVNAAPAAPAAAPAEKPAAGK